MSCGAASTFETTGTSVSRGFASAIALRSRSRAGAMYGVWNAPDTGSGMTFFAPSSFATALAAATPSGEPAMTTCPGALKLATQTSRVGAPAGDLDEIVVEAEDRGHRAGVVVAGVVHRLGALADEPDAVVEAERARGARARCTRRGCGRRSSSARGPAAPTASSTTRLATNVRQLRVAGVLELVRVGIEEQAGDVALGHLGRLVDQLPALVLGPGPAHARPL